MAPTVPSNGRPRRARLGVVLGTIGLVAAMARLPLIRSPVDVSPDGCEYLGIARHLAGEHRWITSLKWNFFTDAPVVHPALADRPPLFPLYAAGWMALTNDPIAQIWLARCGNLLLAAAVPALIYWSLRAVLMPPAAALAAFIFLLYPAFLRISAQPLTEPLFLVFFFGSLGIALRARSAWAWGACGVLAGLASLTRPSGLLLPIVYGGALLAKGPEAGRRRTVTTGADSTEDTALHHPGRSLPRAHGWQPFVLLLLGFALPLLPYGIAVAAQTGSPFTSILRYNYSIRQIDEGTFYGFERSFPPPWLFVTAHAAEVARLVAKQWSTMGWALGRSLQFVLPLGLFWRRRGTGWGHAVLASLALLNFLFHAMSWTVWGAARYMFPSYIIALGLLLEAPVRWAASAREEGVTESAPSGGATGLARRMTANRRQRLATVAMSVAVALALAACLEQDWRLYREKRRPFAGVPLGWAYVEAASRLAASSPGTVCASNQPWILSLLAGRPAVMAPRFRDTAQLRRYLARYRPQRLTLFVAEHETQHGVTAREQGDLDAARRLIDQLWSHPMVKPELRDVLELGKFDIQASPRSREALLMFRVRDPGSAARAQPDAGRFQMERGI